MSTTEERVNRLETVMAELADAQLRTQIALKAFSENTEASLKRLSEAQARTDARLAEAQARTDASLDRLSAEMREFRDEGRASRKEMGRRLGELANQLGTVVENIVAPNIPRMAKEFFGFSDIEDFMVRRQVRNKHDCSKRREFDVIAVGEDAVIINETKSKTRIGYVDDFIELLDQVFDYFPEYAEKKIIPIFASLYLDESVINYLTQNRIYAMTMGGETMEIVNFQQMEA